MKLLLRLAFCLVIGLWFFVVAAWDSIRENRKRRALGADYEGPLEGWDA
jgi:hypothetical protein